MNFLLAGDKFMPGMHLRQPGFTRSNCEPFTKNKEKIQKFIETGDSRYIYQNKLDKVCFQHVMTYGIFEEFPRRTVSYKLLRALALALNALAFNIAETQNMAHTTWTCYNDL